MRPAPYDTTRGDTKATEEGADAENWWWLPALISRGSANKREEILSIHALTAAAGRLVDVGTKPNPMRRLHWRAATVPSCSRDLFWLPPSEPQGCAPSAPKSLLLATSRCSYTRPSLVETEDAAVSWGVSSTCLQMTETKKRGRNGIRTQAREVESY